MFVLVVAASALFALVSAQTQLTHGYPSKVDIEAGASCVLKMQGWRAASGVYCSLTHLSLCSERRRHVAARCGRCVSFRLFNFLFLFLFSRSNSIVQQ